VILLYLAQCLEESGC